MSEDLNNKIKQISDMLSQENLPENLKGLLSLLSQPNSSHSESKTNASSSDSSHNTNENNTLPAKEKNANLQEISDNIDMMRKMKSIMDRLNSNHDPRVNLLLSIKPFLNTQRQKKLTSALNILRLSSLSKVMDESSK